MEKDERAVAGSEILDLAMRRTAWSAPEVSRRTQKTVSPSSVLAYRNARSLPKASSALAIASIFDVETGRELLRAWTYEDTAAALVERAQLVDSGDADEVGRVLRYEGPPLSPDEETAARGLIDIIRGLRERGEGPSA